MATMWAWIGRRKQRAIIAMCMEHIDKIIETIDSLKEMLEHYDRGEFKEAQKSYENVFNREKDCLLYTSPSPRDRG